MKKRKHFSINKCKQVPLKMKENKTWYLKSNRKITISIWFNIISEWLKVFNWIFVCFNFPLQFRFTIQLSQYLQKNILSLLCIKLCFIARRKVGTRKNKKIRKKIVTIFSNRVLFLFVFVEKNKREKKNFD